MARLARVVIPGMPHHVTQRGNRRQPTFFCEDDFGAYVELMGQWCKERGVEVWAYCLMPNHVHLIAVPQSEDSLRRAIGEAHRRYTRGVNFREGWRGHLWQGRFASFDRMMISRNGAEAQSRGDKPRPIHGFSNGPSAPPRLCEN